MATQQKQFSASIAAKYEISGKLQPTNTIFPVRFGSKEMDLSKVPVEVVDAFVKAYPEQDYFKLKSGSAKASTKE